MLLLLSKQTDSKGTTLQRVQNQLIADYPRSALTWLDQADWSEPRAVDTDDVDFQDSIFQRVMSKDGTKVSRFAKRISAGWKKPVVLIKRPNGKLKAIDGHTRLAAYRQLGKPAMAWVGTVRSQSGPWDNFHQLQLSTLFSQTIDLAEHVRTVAGEEWFHEPIGALIIKHSHQELLDMRRDMQAKYPRSDPRVKHIRKAVEESRKAGHNAPNYVAEKRLKDAELPKGPVLTASERHSGKSLAEIDQEAADLTRGHSMGGSENPYAATAINLGIPESEVRLRETRATARNRLKLYKDDPTALDAEQEKSLRDVGEGYLIPPKTLADKVHDWVAIRANVTEKDIEKEFGVSPLEASAALADVFKRPDVTYDKKSGGVNRYGVTSAEQAVADQRAAARKAEREKLPDELNRKLEEIQAKEKARIEVENKARFPGGSLTINDQVQNFGQTASSVPGQSVDRASQVSFSGNMLIDRTDTKAEIEEELERQQKYLPKLAKGVHVQVSPQGTGKTRARNGNYLGGMINVDPELTGRKVADDGNGWHVPSNTTELQRTIAHEIGHGVHRTLAEREGKGESTPTSSKLWTQLASAMHQGAPKSESREAIDSWMRAHRAVISNNVSAYGAQRAPELLAELWAEYSTSNHPRAVATAYGNYVANSGLK